MTKFQKQMLTIAAAGALTAVTALPAMAFENEFHGLFNFNTIFSNYNSAAGGDKSPTALKDKNQMNNYFEQRTRIQYIAKASDDLKLVTHFEINSRFGNSKLGGDLDTDGAGDSATGAGIVVKHAYLQFNVGKNFTALAGLMPYKDTIKGLLVDADVPAVVGVTTLGNYSMTLGYSRLADDSQNGGMNGSATPSRIGDANKDLFLMDNAFAFSKDTKAVFSYYLLADYASSTAGYTGDYYGKLLNAHSQKQAILLHTLALSGQTKLGGLNLSGFAAMQTGHMKADPTATTLPTSTSMQFHGWAANAAADMMVGPGKLKTAFLFTSGDNSSSMSHYNGWATSSVNSYNEGGMMILARNTYNSPTSTDQYIRRDVSNIALLTLGYDGQLTEKFNLNGNVGFGWAPASNPKLDGLTAFAAYQHKDAKTGVANASDFMGTEINLEAGYQLYKNLKLQAQAGYMILGGFYKGAAANSTATAVKDPENPYTMRLQARYTF
ncbi:hypothetical protein [Trichlorobacter lovleyi]|uniref:LamB porin family protein, putative n=1 Tax=Trichlorobacter lovleyi (strain ATCC BAA-1151 / DSM 17278 / SZ) TaxID=398767 RepID=B3EAT0_TRIL1|nr:hypothetical protein [Trichlorobacter lovleyi]ACD96963.1 LamB porin family protein, putative [Trichlorobacter lovleyi SZ]